MIISIALAWSVGWHYSRYAFSIVLILAILPIFLLNIIQIIALGVWVIITIDSVVLVISLGLEILCIVVDEEEALAVFAHLLRLAAFMFWILEWEVSFKLLIWTTWLNKVVKTNDFDKILDWITLHYFESEEPLIKGLKVAWDLNRNVYWYEKRTNQHI